MPRNRNRRHSPNGFGEQAAFYAPVPVPPPLVPSAEPTPSAHVRVLHDRNASVVRVQLGKANPDWTAPAYSFTASGSAKREPKDVHDEEIGELIAAARAFQDLSRQLQREAAKRVRAAALAREAAEEQRIEQRREKLLRRLTPPAHRTLDEWKEIQRQRQHEANARLARTLGLTEPEIGELAAITVTRAPDPAKGRPRHGE